MLCALSWVIRAANANTPTAKDARPRLLSDAGFERNPTHLIKGDHAVLWPNAPTATPSSLKNEVMLIVGDLGPGSLPKYGALLNLTVFMERPTRWWTEPSAFSVGSCATGSVLGAAADA